MLTEEKVRLRRAQLTIAGFEGRKRDTGGPQKPEKTEMEGFPRGECSPADTKISVQ